MDNIKVNSIHSVFYRASDDKSIALHFYKNVETLLIMQLISCSKKITGKEENESDFYKIIEDDGVFCKLSKSNKDLLCKMLVEYYCSTEQDDTDDLSVAIYFLRSIQNLAMTSIKNEIIKLADNTFGKPCREIDYDDLEAEPQEFISVKNITYYGFENDESDEKVVGNYSHYVTYPGKSVPVDTEITNDCLVKCYVKKSLSLSVLFNHVDIYAYLHEIDMEQMRTAVISELINLAIKNTDKLRGKQRLFKDYFKILLQAGGLI